MSLSNYVDILGWAIRIIMLLVILRRRFMPTTALAWLAVIFLVPGIGLIMYILIGDHRLSRKRFKNYRRTVIAARSAAKTLARYGKAVRPTLEPSYLPVILEAERISGMPIVGGNNVELMSDNQKVIERLIADIDAAKYHAHLEFYIFATDATGRRVADALVRAVQRGVKCRLLVDMAGSLRFFGRFFGWARKLSAQGVEVHPMMPVDLFRRRMARLDLRNHRKLVVIDGVVAYTGSQNVVDASYGHRGMCWVDLTGRFTGPIVAQLQTAFLEDWSFETTNTLESPDLFPVLAPCGDMSAQTVPTGPSEEGTSALPRVLLTALNSAQRRIIITTPYLVPDEPTLLALDMAADRGVQIDIVVPKRSDQPVTSAAGRAYFDLFMDAGVHIHLHDKGLLHAKTMTVDDSFALLGSSNMDVRSFHLNFELNVLMYGPQITNELRFAQQCYLSQSQPLDRERWQHRALLRRYADSAAALLSPLL